MSASGPSQTSRLEGNLMLGKTCSQILRDAELTVTNFHDLLCLLCADFQLRVVKSAFKAAWVVLRGELSSAA